MPKLGKNTRICVRKNIFSSTEVITYFVVSITCIAKKLTKRVIYRVAVISKGSISKIRLPTVVAWL